MSKSTQKNADIHMDGHDVYVDDNKASGAHAAPQVGQRQDAIGSEENMARQGRVPTNSRSAAQITVEDGSVDDKSDPDGKDASYKRKLDSETISEIVQHGDDESIAQLWSALSTRLSSKKNPVSGRLPPEGFAVDLHASFDSEAESSRNKKDIEVMSMMERMHAAATETARLALVKNSHDGFAFRKRKTTREWKADIESQLGLYKSPRDVGVPPKLFPLFTAWNMHVWWQKDLAQEIRKK